MARKPKAKVQPAPAPAVPETPPPEVIVVRSRRVACDGDGGALGHPRVWLEMGEANFVECSYLRPPVRCWSAGQEGLESELTAPGVYEGSHGH